MYFTRVRLSCIKLSNIVIGVVGVGNRHTYIVMLISHNALISHHLYTSVFQVEQEKTCVHLYPFLRSQRRKSIKNRMLKTIKRVTATNAQRRSARIVAQQHTNRAMTRRSCLQGNCGGRARIGRRW